LTLVGDDALAEVIRYPHLKSLDLWGTRVSDAGILHLNGNKLTHLGLFGTAVSEGAVAELKKAMPEVEVMLDFSDVRE
jgi:hypothetical protein